MNLQDFCSKDDTRLNVRAPWSIGEHTIATDGRILIRVPRLMDVPENPDAPKIDKLFSDHPVAGEWLDLPADLPKPEYDPCRECNGTGKGKEKCENCNGEGKYECPTCGDGTVECEDCDGSGLGKNEGEVNCEDCDGSGKRRKLQPVKVGKEHVEVRFLRLVKDLPNVKIANCQKALGPLTFKFDGGDGLVMPMRV